MGYKLGNIFSLVTVLIVAAVSESDLPSFHNRSDKTILDYLLDPVRYDFRVRPKDETIVNVTVTLLTLSSPDESSLRYEVEFLLHQVWEDPRLKYNNEGRHKSLNALTHAGKIWIPETYFIKHGDFKYPLVPVHITLRVTPEGVVQYTQRREMILNCQGNLRIFPFDNPKCPFAYESVSNEKTEVKLQWSSTEKNIINATSLRKHNAYLVKNDTGDCDRRYTWRDEYSCLKVLLVFTRDKSFYISTVFAPGIILVSSSFISFWLEINAVPARVMIGVTTMLNFCTTTNSFRSTLPVVSSITAMNMWDGVCMFFIYASMLEFIAVNYLYRKPGYHQSTNRPESAMNQPSTEPSRISSVVAQEGRKFGKYGVGSSHNVELEDNINESNNIQAEVPTIDVSRFQRRKARVVASFVGWLCRPIVVESNVGTRPKLAKKIDNISKMLFPLLFLCFALGFFLTYAVIEPMQDENWTLTE
ncbi:glutamate-gated chloride channel-like [Limulus polyphemus]|uniref:Glutamate-gated chloride channel-like n=1 Tax=Limulus polyphemus TaxID=6850 RepID=A0ABM1SNM5_LIMPO|nr:glutamate-gated chloride channel-like [Limulus polyphemus]